MTNPYVPTAGSLDEPQWLGIYDGQVAISTDPSNQGRVKLYVPQVLGNALSNWAIPMQPGIVPAVGTSVQVMFLGGNQRAPYFFLGVTAGLLVSTQASATVLNSNPFFTGGVLNPWEAVNGTVTAVQPNLDTNPPFTYGVLLTAAGSAPVSLTEIAQPFAVTPGQPYMVSAYAYYPAGGNVDIGLGFLDSSNNPMDPQTETVSVRAGAWQFIQTVQIAPVGAATSYPLVINDNPTALQQLTLEAVTVQGSIPGSLLVPNSVGTDQINFTASQIGGITVYIESAAPASPNDGDLWFDTSAGNILMQWSAASQTWAPYQWGSGAIQEGAIVAGLIAAGAIDGMVINGITINGDTINAADLIISNENGGLFVYTGGPQTTQTFTSTTTWTAPSGVTSVNVQAWAAGGGGSWKGSGGSGSGGGGGEYAAQNSIAVTPTHNYTVTVGTGGIAGTSGVTSGGTGGNSSFPGDSTTVTAHGGTGGTTSAGGIGGSGSGATSHFSGGNGAIFVSGSVPHSQIFTSSGTWKAPSGITSVTASAWGAGGGGNEGWSGGCGSGGGGGGFASGAVGVTPSSTYNVTVGSGGIGGSLQTFNTSWSNTASYSYNGTWPSYDNGGGTLRNTNGSCYQGYYPNIGRGAQVSYVVFPSSNMASALSGATINTVKLTATCLHAYYTDLTAILGWTTRTSFGSSVTSYGPDHQNITHWQQQATDKGGSSNVVTTLDASWGTIFQSNGATGLMFGEPTDSNAQDYGYWDGAVGHMTLTINYTKGVSPAAGSLSKFVGDSTTIQGNGGGAAGNVGGTGGTGSGTTTHTGGSGANAVSGTSILGRGGGGGAGSGGAGGNASGQVAGAGGTPDGGAGGTGGANSGSNLNGSIGNAPGGGGGGGGNNSSGSFGSGGSGARGQVELSWNVTTIAGGGGGSSGGTSSAGNNGGTELGAAAVTGGGPGGGVLSGGVWTAAPSTGPGGGAGGYDPAGNPAAGANGQVTLTWTSGTPVLIFSICGFNGTLDPITGTACPEGPCLFNNQSISFVGTSSEFEHGQIAAPGARQIQFLAPMTNSNDAQLQMTMQSAASGGLPNFNYGVNGGNSVAVSASSAGFPVVTPSIDSTAYQVGRATVYTTGTQVINSTGQSVLSGLSVNVAAGCAYRFHAVIRFVSNSTNDAYITMGGTATTTAFNAFITYLGGAVPNGTSQGQATTTQQTALGTNTGLESAVLINTGTYVCYIDGRIVVNAAGTLNVSAAASANATSYTTQSGSMLEVFPDN